jgi:hypothetical protein
LFGYSLFFDENGSTVGLLYTLLLMKFGYPLAIVLQANKKNMMML